MTVSTFHPGNSSAHAVLHGDGQALIQPMVAIFILFVSIAGLLISIPTGVAITAALALALAILMPAAAPVVLVVSFLFQNLIVAMFTPLVEGAEAFNALRGANFVILATIYCAFLLADLLTPGRDPVALRPSHKLAFAALGVAVVYAAIGVVRGAPSDAAIYLRNTITPIACFHIGLYAAMRYRLSLARAIGGIAVVIIAYGYGEMLFGLDFLGLFNGDRYLNWQMLRQIESGYWEEVMRDTGFVLTNIRDVMMTTFFNTPLLDNLFPKVFRLNGPNFHAISYAYALAVIASWLVFRGRWAIPLLALPLLLVVGSKGAAILFLMSVLVKFGHRVLTLRTVLALFLAATLVWLTAAIVVGLRDGDYHVLGFIAGIQEFAKNPIGQGIGIGGNLSSSIVGKLDWSRAQALGATDIPVESAVGVMLYQMGVGAFVFFAFVGAVALACYRSFRQTRHPDMLFGVVALVTISANAVLQEEAYYSPLGLGLALLLVSTALGAIHRTGETTPRAELDDSGRPGLL